MDGVVKVIQTAGVFIVFGLLSYGIAIIIGGLIGWFAS